MRDLGVVCPDQDWKAVLESILERHQSLGLRAFTSAVYVNSLGHDGGTRAHARTLAGGLTGTHRHALVVFDRHGSGSSASDVDLEAEIESVLSPDWADRACCVVVEPELEMWLVGAHQHFGRVDRLAGSDPRAFWDASGVWPKGTPKPTDPKAAIHRFFQSRQVRPTSAYYRRIAQSASLSTEKCQCRSFKRMATRLRDWFSV